MRADQLFLTRRMFVIKGAIVVAFTTLVGKLAHMQIVKGEVFAQQAEENTQTFQPMKAPRGLIYDRAGRPLAENRRSWEVRIVPAELPDEKVQPIDYQRVRETLINWLRLPEALVVNPAGVPIGSERTVYGRIANLLGDDDVDWWVDYITQRAKINYLVMCDDELTADRAATFRAAAQELPGVEVVSIFDYRVTNIGDPRQPVVIKNDVSREVALKLLSNSIYLPGVQLDDTQLTRAYPSGDVMSHLLGYASIIQKEDLEDPKNKTEGGTPLYLPDDVIGQAGIERSLEDVLRGQKGGRWVEVDTHGVQQRILGENPVVPGKNLKLTIDLELQAAASEALQVGFAFSNEDRRANDVQENAPPKEYTAGAGAVVALDPRTGEVLAMVSFPTYDNRLFLEGISARKYKAYQEDKYHPLINKCVAEHYAPGSTFKLFHAAAALRERVIDETTTFTCTGAIRVPWTWDESKGSAYPCWNRWPGHGTLDIYDAIEQSCDIFFYNAGTPRQKLEGQDDYLHYYDYNMDSEAIGDRHDFVGLGIEKIKMNMTKRFWFGRTTGIDLPWESPGLVPDAEWKWDTKGEGWSSGDTIITSIGQGDFLCTPLQLAVNTASLANGGEILRPLLVKEIVDDKKEAIQSFDPELLRDMRLSGTFLNIVREGMRRVVHGEQSSAASENRDGSSKWEFTNPKDEEEIIIAGKTGTAEFGLVNEETLEYEQQHAWFTCYAPFDDPEIVVTVIVEDGGEGSNYAVPIVDKVLRAYFELSGRRQRGTILREDKRPVGDDAPAPEGLLFMAEPGTRTPLIPAD
ncbi:MAG: penicillin-binding protein 2 [Thermomicrobiales bacterium]